MKKIVLIIALAAGLIPQPTQCLNWKKVAMGSIAAIGALSILCLDSERFTPNMLCLDSEQFTSNTKGSWLAFGSEINKECSISNTLYKKLKRIHTSIEKQNEMATIMRGFATIMQESMHRSAQWIKNYKNKN